MGSSSEGVQELGDRRSRMPTMPFLAVWHGLSALLLLFLPPSIRFTEPFWAIPSEHVPGVLATVVAYLAGAWIFAVRPPATRPPDLRAWSARLIQALLCYPVVALLFALRPALPYSRTLLAMAAVLGVMLLSLPLLLGRARYYGAAALFVAVSAATVWGLDRAGTPSAPAFGFALGQERPYVMTNEHSLRLQYQTGLVGRQVVRGGALEPYEDGFLLVTGSGEFYELAWNEDLAGVQATQSPLRAPMNRGEFLADVDDATAGSYFRVADLLLDTSAVPVTVYVSHHYWNRQEECFTLRISATSLGASGGAAESTPWRTVFETAPCLPVMDGFENSIQAGGRLLRGDDGRLLLSVGDHGFDGVGGDNLPQSSTADYGKIVAIDEGGNREILMSGFRNPQGLTRDSNGALWATDQGPEGGDELNRLEEGANYGWPLATYGTQYQMTVWPLAQDTRGHGEFKEPAYVWVPSPAISGLITVRSEMFPAWEGDLIASSLRDQSLYRIRLRDEGVAFAEPIRIGRRIRDLAEARTGAIVLWTESGDIVTISRAGPPASGEALFAGCASCHEGDGGPAIAPTLRGIVGRPVASVPGYPYSEALRRVQGTWTIPRLAEFLQDAQEFAPGTSMIFESSLTPLQARTLLEYLRHYE